MTPPAAAVPAANADSSTASRTDIDVAAAEAAVHTAPAATHRIAS